MKERPILFKAEMVRAILDGRKTITRRLVKPPPVFCADGGYWSHESGTPQRAEGGRALHYANEAHLRKGYAEDWAQYRAGDRLWVKETWRPRVRRDAEGTCDGAGVSVEYAADGSETYVCDDLIDYGWNIPKAAKRGNVTPLFMPRWASRLTLEVTSVRIEPLQDISRIDAAAEGLTFSLSSGWLPGCCLDPRWAFRELWDSINGKRVPWSSNPWVWRIEFRRLEQETRAA